MPFIPFANTTSRKWDDYQYSEEIMDSKDERAIHQGRQHALHASDRRKGKAGRSSKPHGGSRNPFTDATADDFPVNDTSRDKDYSTWPEMTDRPDVGARVPRAAPQVTLAEIIKPGRKKKGVAGDFEIVPRPGEVLTLDEGFEDDDELYAGWEDISLGVLRGTNAGHDAAGASRLGFPPISYAAALSASARR